MARKSDVEKYRENVYAALGVRRDDLLRQIEALNQQVLVLDKAMDDVNHVPAQTSVLKRKRNAQGEGQSRRRARRAGNSETQGVLSASTPGSTEAL